MATHTPDLPLLDDPPATQVAPTDPDLVSLRDEVRRQGRSIQASQRAFTIFAVIGFVVAMATFLAVVFKLDKKSTTAASPVVATAKPATLAAPVLGHSVGVSLREFVVGTNTKAAAAGNVTFQVRNSGNVAHEFVVLRTDKPAADLLKGAEADESGNVGELGDLAPGASKALKLNLKAGHYALICNLPGHYKAGQYADFTVR